MVPFLDKMREKGHVRSYVALAEPPTVTLPRVKVSMEPETSLLRLSVSYVSPHMLHDRLFSETVLCIFSCHEYVAL